MTDNVIRLSERGRPYRPHAIIPNPLVEVIASVFSLNAALYGLPARYWADVAAGLRNGRDDVDLRPCDSGEPPESSA